MHKPIFPIRANSEVKFYAIFATLSDGGDDAYVIMHDVPIVVKSGLGDTVPKFIMDKFMVLSKKAEVGGRVYWADFSRLVPEALLLHRQIVP